MRLGIDSWSAVENDYVNSACREKRKSYSKRYDKMSSCLAKWSFGDDAILVTDWNTVYCHIALHFISIKIPDDM